MNLSMWTSYYVDLSPEEAVSELKKNGYNYCELSDEHGAELLARGDAKTVGAAFKKYCDDIGMTVSQGHLYLKVRLCDETQPILDIMKNWLDLYYAIGVKSAVLHCDHMMESSCTHEEKLQKNLAVIKQLVDYLKGTDMVICLENLTRLCLNADDLMWFVEQINSENLGICLDTGHLNMSETPDQVAFIRRVGKHLKALHIADNQGETDQHMLPFGRGNVDIEAVMQALKEVGYEGLFNYEVPGERLCPLEIRAAKLAYAKTIYEYLVK